MAGVVSIWLALILGVSAALKARRPEEAAGALATYGIAGERGRRVTLWMLVSVELVLAGAVAAGMTWASGAVAGLFLVFAVTTAGALLAGRGGRPCACFGSASRLSWYSPLRALALALAAGSLALGWLPHAPSTYDQWLTLGLSISIAALIALALAVLALAREVGVLRMGMGGRGALEIPQEGPQVGSEQEWAAAIPVGPRALLRLAIFSSEGCPLCHQVEPAVEHVAADPLLAVRIFDEAADPDSWRAASVPGSPYAVALSREGVVLAKGSFNNLGQLESILGTARFRERELPLAA